MWSNGTLEKRYSAWAEHSVGWPAIWESIVVSFILLPSSHAESPNLEVDDLPCQPKSCSKRGNESTGLHRLNSAICKVPNSKLIGLRKSQITGCKKKTMLILTTIAVEEDFEDNWQNEKIMVKRVVTSNLWKEMKPSECKHEVAHWMKKTTHKQSSFEQIAWLAPKQSRFTSALSRYGNPKTSTLLFCIAPPESIPKCIKRFVL